LIRPFGQKKNGFKKVVTKIRATKNVGQNKILVNKIVLLKKKISRQKKKILDFS